MAKQSPIRFGDIDTRDLQLLRLWALRAIVHANGAAAFVGKHGFGDEHVAAMLGYTRTATASYTPEWATKSLRRKLGALERKLPTATDDTVLKRNIATLARRLGLDAVEQGIVHLVAAQRVHGAFSEALNVVGDLTDASVCRLVATCLDIPVEQVQQALHDRSRLSRSALLGIDRSRAYPFAGKIDMRQGLAEALQFEQGDLLDLFNSSILASPEPRLSLEDFAHLTRDVVILRGYLQAAARDRKSGVNILVHGRSGTGKTEFVRALARAASARLLEVATEEPDGTPRVGRSRFDAYRFAQSLLAGESGSVMLFDDVEDVFRDGPDARQEQGNTSGIKGWVNLLLEGNLVPTFWVTNQISAIDPAYLRRFDYVLHVDIPPASARRRLIDGYAAAMPLSERWRDQVARHEQIAPAVVERALRVGAMVCDVMPEVSAAEVMTRVMGNTLVALGSRPLQPVDNDLELPYALGLLNADCNLENLQEGLRRVGEGRICLYGPPGTGKTAFGRHVAEALDRPLVVKRASDILSPYLGIAERNIAKMFEQARVEGAVLLFDEADSLLQDRRGAQRSWEVTQVNEMLTQMESFQGIFIASTNLMDSLDQAAMRRFDARIRLGYLAAEQAWQMFEVLSERLGLALNSAARRTLGGLSQLTPGDFAAAARLCRLDRPADAEQLANRLRLASEAKRETVQRSIGFSA